MTLPRAARSLRLAPSSRSADSRRPDPRRNRRKTGKGRRASGRVARPGSGPPDRKKGRKTRTTIRRRESRKAHAMCPSGNAARPTLTGSPLPRRKVERPTTRWRGGWSAFGRAAARASVPAVTARRLLGAPEPERPTVAGSFGSRRAGRSLGFFLVRSRVGDGFPLAFRHDPGSSPPDAGRGRTP